MIPTRRLALLALVVAVSLWFLPVDLGSLLVGFLAVNALLIAVGVADAFAGANPRDLEIVRHLPPVIVMGREGELTWTVRNNGSRRARFALADDLAPSLSAEVRRAGATLDPNGTATLGTTLHPTRRGRFHLSEVVVRSTGPLGLMARQRRREIDATLRVHPPFKSRDEAELRIRKARILEVGLRSARGLGGGTEFEQLREYTSDDEFRRVDWAASARAGRPIVRTYRPERNQTVMVLLDNGRLMAANVDGVPRLEHGIDATIMLTAVASGLGDRIGLVTFDQRVRSIVAPARHREQVSRVTEAMFDLEPVLAESDYTEAFRQTLARFRRRALLVILTDLAPGAMTGSLLPAMPLILRSHLVVIGAVRDPEVTEWATGPVLDAAQAYRKSAALTALAERDLLIARLRGLGVTVVDAVPGRLAPELADVYIRVKSTGRL
ncbi:MAG: DUF58 domain-containing protein [Acidimicrobiales bacterium]